MNFAAFIQENPTLPIKLVALETVLELVFAADNIAKVKPLFAQGVMQLDNIVAVVLAMIIQRLTGAQVVSDVAVKFALIFRFLAVKSKWTIPCAAPDKLRLGQDIGSCTRFIKTHNVEQIQNVPASSSFLTSNTAR